MHFCASFSVLSRSPPGIDTPSGTVTLPGRVMPPSFDGAVDVVAPFLSPVPDFDSVVVALSPLLACAAVVAVVEVVSFFEQPARAATVTARAATGTTMRFMQGSLLVGTERTRSVACLEG